LAPFWPRTRRSASAGPATGPAPQGIRHQPTLGYLIGEISGLGARSWAPRGMNLEGRCAYLALTLSGRLHALERSAASTSDGRLVPVLAFGQRARERDDSLLMLSDRNVQVVVDEIQEHPLLG
jgi:hypothetical protein